MSIPSAGHPRPYAAAPQAALRRAACATLLGYAIVAAACGSLQLPEPQDTSTDRTAPAPAPGTRTGTPPAPAPVTMPTGVEPRIALLLPLSGAQAAVGEAVRDGFLAAWLADTGANRPDVAIFDETAGARAAYASAGTTGTTMVVGPLLKDSVAEVLPTAGTVPTLALNNLEAPLPTPVNFYQFALAPEDEARQVAERAAGEGLTRAVALVPESDWGRRVLTAFTPALEERGGKLLAYRFYDPAETDFTAQIQRLLLIDESRARHKALNAYLGIATEFEPRTRGDLDFIFLAANVAAGRLIRPQLRFLYAGDIPTYATSAIYQPGTSGDADLDGVRFTDAPALIGSDQLANTLRTTLERRWPPGAVARMRFYAMGHDAYTLASAITTGSSGGLFGLSGMLTFDADRRVHRRMPWAEFRAGGLASLPSVESPGATGLQPAQ